MLRFFKESFQIDWKYILVELILIVTGILLAINLNNWSANRKLKSETKISIDKISEELEFNLKELKDVHEINSGLADFLRSLNDMKEGQKGSMRITSDELGSIRRKYADYFTVEDSTQVNDDLFDYDVQIFYQLEYAELNDIAWQTAQISNAINTYRYDCLKQIIEVYSFQDLFVEVQNRFLNYEIMENYKRFLATFQLYHKMSQDLLGRYEELKSEINNCR